MYTDYSRCNFVHFVHSPFNRDYTLLCGNPALYSIANVLTTVIVIVIVIVIAIGRTMIG